MLVYKYVVGSECSFNGTIIWGLKSFYLLIGFGICFTSVSFVLDAYMGISDCYSLGTVLRHIIRRASRETNHSLNQELNGIVVCFI